jgi:transcriptional regulator with XRE-family HTH domain
MSSAAQEQDRKRLSGIRIKTEREDADLTQEELAGEMEVTTGTISNWERGIYTPSKGKFKLMHELFGASIPYLRGSSDERNEEDRNGSRGPDS